MSGCPMCAAMKRTARQEALKGQRSTTNQEHQARHNLPGNMHPGTQSDCKVPDCATRATPEASS